MTRVLRAIVALPVAVLVSGCTAGGGASERPEPVPSLSPPTPTAPATLPADPREIAAWAEIALPENRPGGSGAVVRASGRIGAGGEATVAPATEAGPWVALVACIGAGDTVMTLRVESPDLPDAAGVEVPCATAGSSPPPATRMTFTGDPAIVLRLSGAEGTAYAYEIRARGGDAD